MTDHLTLDTALGGAALEMVREEMRTAAGSAAKVSGLPQGQALAFSPRKATRLTVSDAAEEAVRGVLEANRAAIADHFGRALDGCEEPQFLRYVPGDYFVAHQDGNTPVIHDHTRFRKVSVVIFLSEQSEQPREGAYSGGSLVLHGPHGRPELQVALAPAPGTLVAFPSEATHEVLPITGGERLSIVSWYRHEAD